VWGTVVCAMLELCSLLTRWMLFTNINHHVSRPDDLLENHIVELSCVHAINELCHICQHAEFKKGILVTCAHGRVLNTECSQSLHLWNPVSYKGLAETWQLSLSWGLQPSPPWELRTKNLFTISATSNLHSVAAWIRECMLITRLHVCCCRGGLSDWSSAYVLLKLILIPFLHSELHQVGT